MHLRVLTAESRITLWSCGGPAFVPRSPQRRKNRKLRGAIRENTALEQCWYPVMAGTRLLQGGGAAPEPQWNVEHGELRDRRSAVPSPAGLPRVLPARPQH